MQCGVGSVCGAVSGQEYCLKPCASFTDCRFGYVCAPAGSMGEQVCVPPCENNEACGAGFVCNDMQYCVSTDSGMMGETGSSAPAEEGCQQRNSKASTLLLLSLLITLLVRRRALA